MTKNYSTLNELAFNIANFFGATRGNNNTQTYIENALNTHKKEGGKHVVLIVSNGLTQEVNETKNFSEKNNGLRILDSGKLVDKTILALGHDRSTQIYKDTVDCIQQSTILQNASLVPTARFFNSKDKDQNILNAVCSHIYNSVQPTFSVACLNSSFLTPSGNFTHHIEPIKSLIEETNSTGTLYLLTSRNKTAEPKKSANQVLQPIVPLLIVAELLHRYRLHEKQTDLDNNKQLNKISSENLSQQISNANLLKRKFILQDMSRNLSR
ncbi:MAG: hypothetical protein J6V53_07265 [Alphaproteobacteria bacterium]|nr:hypothetical protein [Alphaproteobacteria bacterium]